MKNPLSLLFTTQRRFLLELDSLSKKRTPKRPTLSQTQLYKNHLQIQATIKYQKLIVTRTLMTNTQFTATTPKMANTQLKPVASLLLVLNFCMYVVVLGIGGWAMNKAINLGFEIGPDLSLPAHFSPIYFPMGNEATGFFVVFSLIAGVVGSAAAISGVNHIRCWTAESLPSAASAATIAWSLTLLAMGFAWKEIQRQNRNSRLKTMEAFLIILSATQLIYIAAIHTVSRK